MRCLRKPFLCEWQLLRADWSHVSYWRDYVKRFRFMRRVRLSLCESDFLQQSVSGELCSVFSGTRQERYNSFWTQKTRKQVSGKLPFVMTVAYRCWSWTSLELVRECTVYAEQLTSQKSEKRRHHRRGHSHCQFASISSQCKTHGVSECWMWIDPCAKSLLLTLWQQLPPPPDLTQCTLGCVSLPSSFLEEST